MAGVGVLAAAVGTGAAWLVTMYRFPGQRWLDYALLFPLANPAYIGAYALVDFLNYSGPVQGGLRLAMGWQSARDYWFPEIHSLGFAMIVLAAALYPYVYLLARAAFREQSGASYEVARSLGRTRAGVLQAVYLPLMRGSVSMALLVVFVDCVKELPATLLLRPFNFNTLSTRAYDLASLERIGEAAPSALLVIAVSLAAVVLMARTLRA